MRYRGATPWSVVALLSLCACKEAETLTQVVVVIDAEHDLRARVAKLHTTVEPLIALGKLGKDRLLAKPFVPKWPVHIALAPENGEATHRYLVSTSALDDAGNVLVTARLLSSFVAHELRYAYVLLDERCVHVMCDPFETCRAGACARAEIEANDLSASAAEAMHSDNLPPSGRSDASVQASDASVHANDAHVDASDTGVDASDTGQDDPDGRVVDKNPDAPQGPDAADCKAGYEGSNGECFNVDECDRGLAKCTSGETCRDTEGSFVCECKPGYARSNGKCADIDECALDDDDCDDDPDACMNTTGGFDCACPSGYSGSGVGDSCRDVDECKTTHGGCDAHATCENTTGSRTCECVCGYRGDGLACAFSVQNVGNGPPALDTYVTFAANYLYAYPVAVEQAARLQNLAVISKSSAARLRMALYADDGGKPGAKLVESAVSGIMLDVATINAFDQPPCTTLEAATYWLVMLADQTFAITSDTSTSDQEQYVDYPWDGTNALPDDLSAKAWTTNPSAKLNAFIVTD